VEYLYGLGYEARDMAGGADLDDLLHLLLGVSAEGAYVGVRVSGVVYTTLQRRHREIRRRSETKQPRLI
jgi:hypothetical protein